MHIIHMYLNITDIDDIGKISATVYEIFNKIKTGSSELSNVSSKRPLKTCKNVNKLKQFHTRIGRSYKNKVK